MFFLSGLFDCSAMLSFVHECSRNYLSPANLKEWCPPLTAPKEYAAGRFVGFKAVKEVGDFRW